MKNSIRDIIIKKLTKSVGNSNNPYDLINFYHSSYLFAGDSEKERIVSITEKLVKGIFAKTIDEKTDFGIVFLWENSQKDMLAFRVSYIEKLGKSALYRQYDINVLVEENADFVVDFPVEMTEKENIFHLVSNFGDWNEKASDILVKDFIEQLEKNDE